MHPYTNSEFSQSPQAMHDLAHFNNNNNKSVKWESLRGKWIFLIFLAETIGNLCKQLLKHR